MPLTSTTIHRYSDCPSMKDGDTTHGDHQFEDELPQVSCPACREYLGLDPLPDVADRLYDAYINATADTFLSVDDENAIKDAYNEIRLLRDVVRTFTEGRPWGDCVSIRRSSFGYVRFSNSDKVAVIQRAYDAERG